MTSRFLAAALGALILGACSGKAPVQTAGPATATVSPSEIDAIAELLYQGNRKEARRRVEKALDRDPANPALLMLKQSITGDAREDLGPTNFPYVVQRGDTMTGLASRFLGNRLKAYQLARYNDIENPNNLTAGTVLRIPGQPPRPAKAAATRAPSAVPKAPGVASKVKAPAAARVDRAGAKRAQAAGLTALNQGRVADAVTQLRRAAALDPGNAAIGRDLARAERIAATVKARN